MVNLTTIEIARLAHGRRMSKGKWMAKCPAHREKTGSLSITQMPNGNTRLHCFAGCSQHEVVNAMGLRWYDLTPEGEIELTKELRQRLKDSDRLDRLRRQNGLALIMQAVEPEKRNYWKAVERNTAIEGQRLRDKLYPEQKLQREHEARVQAIIREYGFDELMNCVRMEG